MSKGKELRKPKSKGLQADKATVGASVEDLLAEAPNGGLRVGKTESTVLKVPNTRKGDSKR